MRRNLAKFPCSVIGRPTSTSSATFSTIGGGGGRGGRGRGGPIPFQVVDDSPPKKESDDSKFEDAPPSSQGRGRGRGQHHPSSPILPSLSSFLNRDPKAPSTGRGRGFVPSKTIPPSPRDESDSTSEILPKPDNKPQFIFAEDKKGKFDSSESEIPTKLDEILPSEISGVLRGAGRGKPVRESSAPPEKPKVENRHIRTRQQSKSPDSAADSPREQLSEEEKVKKAMGILTRGDPVGERDTVGFRGGRGARGRGMRGRGRGRGRFGGRGRLGEDRYEESDDDPAGLNIGDPHDEEKLAEKLGPKVMNELAEGFEEMSSRVLPSPADDAYLDALHTNLLIECEPEYLMEEFGTNPDIDEKPPIPLREALEKMKPFLMAYEGIESQEEWEEVIEETMKTVPLMKEIVDYYSGPDRVTAKQQQEELERVAKTLPTSAPASVKRFTDRAVLSLQSNPGWGFDKKCQFMDKLVMEVSKQYK